MRRVVVFGRGGSGKSTLSRRLGAVTGIPVTELDSVYWDATLAPLTLDEWASRQVQLVAGDSWILDGDLGPYDVTAPRLERADTVLLVDTPLLTCLWRAARRGGRRVDFWVWVLRWGRTDRRRILDEVRQYAPEADLVILRTSQQTERWLAGARSG